MLNGLSLKICFFFFNKVQEFGLEPAYRADSRTYKYIRKVMALPFLPEAEITPMFHGLNSRANNRVHLPFYLLVELLHQEARLVSIQIRLMSDGKLSRIQRKKYRLLQSKIFKTLTATRFLPAAFSNSAVT